MGRGDSTEHIWFDSYNELETKLEDLIQRGKVQDSVNGWSAALAAYVAEEYHKSVRNALHATGRTITAEGPSIVREGYFEYASECDPLRTHLETRVRLEVNEEREIMAVMHYTPASREYGASARFFVKTGDRDELVSTSYRMPEDELVSVHTKDALMRYFDRRVKWRAGTDLSLQRA